MSNQFFDKQGRYILQDFDRSKPFTSFLPGIAGLDGIPLWVFYVNRGQCISSFGIASKDFPIMEFQPANKAYRQTPLTGFRTFIKFQDASQPAIYEPFSEIETEHSTRRMYIGMEEVEIEEVHEAIGLKVNIRYYTIPNEDFSALVRQVRIKNISKHKKNIEFLDGMPVIIPYGVNNFFLKELGRTVEAWMEVFNLENGIPFYKVRASIEDSAKVQQVSTGNFALAYLYGSDKSQTLEPIVDPGVIFGSHLSFTQPANFLTSSLDEIYARPQRTLGQTPCAFFGESTEISPDAEIVISSVFGNIDNLKKLKEIRARITRKYLKQKLHDAKQISKDITAPIEVKTAKPIFDAYAGQTYLDNVLRGGLPLSLPGESIYHVYSRKHGDPERDYNFFYLAPEYYSQGNGNYRDVNQNRRSDVLFYPGVGDFNLRFFLSLIQLDGYNPLIIKGTKFVLGEHGIETVLGKISLTGLSELLSQPFTPGSLVQFLSNDPGEMNLSREDIFELVFSHADQVIDAEHGEGFWVDHWTYNLDLIDSFLAIYPDRQNEMLFSQRDIPWYESFAKVQPRGKRYSATESGLRQYAAVIEDEEKFEEVKDRGVGQTWVRAVDNANTIYRSSVFEKLFILLALKSATLDPAGMGVEMEAGKPGWYDALNGLPGLLGSSVSETYEIARLVTFLRFVIDEQDDERAIRLPVEFCDFLVALTQIFSGPNEDPLELWHQTSTIREEYQHRIYSGVSGEERAYPLEQIKTYLQVIKGYIDQAITRIENLNADLPPTYFFYEAINSPILGEKSDSSPAVDVSNLKFQQHILPPFLEGCVHAMRISDKGRARRVYQAVHDSDLFDEKLGMYKVNAPLADVSLEVGRATSFPPGWLENESIWLHMEYKYLLELLRSELYEEFYRDIQTALVPFQPAHKYGRSPLENSSFIVSSAYPDSALHGTGFVARLSGSTAEFLTIWFEMFAGRNPFVMQDGELALRLKPRLAHWFFPESGQVEFTFLGHTRVKIDNPQLLDTWQTNITAIELAYHDGRNIRLDSDVIPSPHALQVREGNVQSINIRLGENHSE